MKIAIVSDMHIGYERFVDDAFNQAREALEKASDMADAIIMPGDVFDKRSPKPEVLAQAINIFRDLSKKDWKTRVVSFNGRGTETHTNIPVIGISGTHERTAFGKENPLSLLGLAGLIVDTSEATTIVEKDGEKVAVYGLGGLAEDRVKDTLKELDPKPTKGAFNIFMFHQSTHELLPFNDDFIHYDDLPEGFDLYVDGHIHSRVDATVHGKPFIIPGSTVLTQLKEGEQEGKGFVLFDTSDGSYKFVKIHSRKLVFKTLEFKDASPKEVKDRCEKEIDEVLKESPEKPIIRLKLQGTVEAGLSGADISLHSVMLAYAQKVILDVDSSKLVNPQVQSEIENLRDNKIGNMPVKELGMSILGKKLKEQKFDDAVNYTELFSILSNESKKDKIIKEAMEFLSKD